MVSSHVSVDIPFHHHHCDSISSTAIGEWEQPTSSMDRGWTRVFMFFQALESGVQSLLARALASEARTKQRAKAQPRSSLALLLHRVPGPACSWRPDDGSGDGPKQPRDQGRYLMLFTSNNFKYGILMKKKLKFWNRMRSASSRGSLSPLSFNF
jgi:hypothetical protein